MKVYQVQIDYSPNSIIRIGPVKSSLKAKKLAMRLQEDKCYKIPDAKWSILAVDLPFFQWLFT